MTFKVGTFSSRHPREGGDPGGLVTYSERVILDPRLRGDDGGSFCAKICD